MRLFNLDPKKKTYFIYWGIIRYREFRLVTWKAVATMLALKLTLTINVHPIIVFTDRPRFWLVVWQHLRQSLYWYRTFLLNWKTAVLSFRLNKPYSIEKEYLCVEKKNSASKWSIFPTFWRPFKHHVTRWALAKNDMWSENVFTSDALS